MWQCNTCGEMHDNQFDSCWKCANNGNEIIQGDEAEITIVSGVEVSTIPTIPNKRIIKSLGLACGETIIGANVISDTIAGFTDFFGGRSGTYESKLKSARLIAVNEMKQEAKQLGANAVVGVKIEFEVIREAMLMACATGTAVIVADE